MSTIDMFRDMLVGEKCNSLNTVSAYISDVKLFLTWLEDNKLDFNSDAFYSYLRSCGYTKTTLARKTVAISTWVNFCMNDLGISLEFARPKIKAQNGSPSILSNQDLEKLLQYVRGGKDNFRIKMRAIVELLYSSGMRVSELVSLKLSHAKDLIENKQMSIIGKGDKERIVFVNDDTVDAIQVYMKHNNPSDHLFETRAGNSMNRQSIHRQLKILANRAGVCEKKVFPHSFRHRLASNLNQNGMNLAEIKELFGHSKIKTTLLYTHLDHQWMIDLLRDKHPLSDL